MIDLEKLKAFHMPSQTLQIRARFEGFDAPEHLSMELVGIRNTSHVHKMPGTRRQQRLFLVMCARRISDQWREDGDHPELDAFRDRAVELLKQESRDRDLTITREDIEYRK